MTLPDIVLHQPEIPANSGNVIRLAANTGFGLHLVEPLGFELDDKRLRRAGLDYAEWARLRVHPDWPSCQAALPQRRWLIFSTKGLKTYTEVDYREDDVLVFGSETCGLPAHVMAAVPTDQQLRLPMQPHSRSLNLSNAVAVAVFEAWRQLGFAGAGDTETREVLA